VVLVVLQDVVHGHVVRFPGVCEPPQQVAALLRCGFNADEATAHHDGPAPLLRVQLNLELLSLDFVLGIACVLLQLAVQLCSLRLFRLAELFGIFSFR
jgi:hypothetical protein